MMAARLVLGALSSVCAGFVVAWITRSRGTAAKVLGIVLIAMFGLWDKFPIWYHMIFLVSLLPLTLAGAILKAQPDRPKTKIPANSRLTPKPDIKYALVWALLLGARFSSSRARGLSYLAL
jgi:uncharacterized membrane protein